MTEVSEHRQRIKEILTVEYLRKKFCDDKWSAEKIANESGFKVCTVRNRLNRLKVHRGRRKIADLTGRKFGQLTVLSFREGYRWKNIVWNCVCDCGNPRQVTSGNLISGGTKSCGCIKFKTGKESRAWRGYGDLSGRYWCIMQHNAAERGHAFSITIEYAWSLFFLQKERCNLTNWKISLTGTQTASLDRIDSKNGYVEGNVQWVHKDVNKMKNAFSQKYFIAMCKNVAKNH